ncbi:hypothetical protein TREMEDRAFT_35889 [Tremella mesenterica DSM 1558]|uniref:uncharacterized protein n=1 Tax=Tremella mesenterica (strain ATCC 24925 / CBS 8224 / DSM 1558 / NBRC 9311 / NRRL Y-6157 / RJB 2259-6 / UBC 559-6) TaxID=578456 RepID=UPI00032C3A62|nr:uncharacterized protein TREMEDRAFT_35889 [Tremella mesenterica DSM 1558]EIW65808.1 hypothetical protein TREMEDRAFT_35889 [Tremella mesenterica DSM 1558]
MSDDTYLRPPRPNFVNPDHVIPLSPPPRPPFARYHTASTLPSTPHTPFPPSEKTPPPPPPSESTGLTPFLGLSPRLILATLSPALLPLILTIAHLIQTRSSTASLAASLKSSILSACDGLAQGAASIQMLPRYLAMQTNDEVVRATQASILAIGAGLIDCVTIIETVVGFIVDTYRSMLLCTIQLAIQGTLEVVIGAVQVISDNITSTMNSVRTGIQNDIASANSAIQTAVTKLNSVSSYLGVTISVPEFSIPSLSALENVTIPTSFEDSLIKLNSSIPSLDTLRDKMTALLDTPFEALKTSINASRIEMAASFNSSILPVPSLQSLSAQDSKSLSDSLCNGLDTSLIDDTANALHKLSSVAIGLMFLLLFLAWAALCVWEWHRWKVMKDTVDAVQQQWDRGQRNAWRMVAVVEHPVLDKYSSRVLDRFFHTERTKNNLRWFASYLAHPTNLTLLFISLLGLIALSFQLLALDAIKTHAQENANATVTASTNALITKLNAAAQNSSLGYANQFNTAVNVYEARINEELFGSWINTTAVTLNSTLVEFYNEIESILNSTFGGTILYNPINTFVYCILGSKITNLEQGLTWVSQHAQVVLPTLPTNVLMVSNSSMNELVSPITSAAVGSSSPSSSNSSNTGAVGSLIDHFESALRVERNFYAILLGVYVALFLIGLFVVLWHSGLQDRYASWRGKEQTSEVNKSQWRWTGGNPIAEQYNEDKIFRGNTPPIPQIMEIDPSGSRRPAQGRKTTFGSITSLAAPGQAFLKMTGWRNSSNIPREFNDDKIRLQHGSSEIYNSSSNPIQTSNMMRQDDLESPPPFWVNKFYRAVETAKSMFPTRGMKHGAALDRNVSQRTERSFGINPVTPREHHDYQGNGEEGVGEGEGPFADEEYGRWSMIDPISIRKIESETSSGNHSDSRYPLDARPNLSNPFISSNPQSLQQQQQQNTKSKSVYPRPMSRAPTLYEGMSIPRTIIPGAYDLPPLPEKDVPNFSITQHSQSRYDQPRTETVVSPTSSDKSWFSEPTVENASRVQTGTAALAAVFAGLQRRQADKEREGVREERGNPFVTPFD